MTPHKRHKSTHTTAAIKQVAKLSSAEFKVREIAQMTGLTYRQVVYLRKIGR